MKEFQTKEPQIKKPQTNEFQTRHRSSRLLQPLLSLRSRLRSRLQSRLGSLFSSLPRSLFPSLPRSLLGSLQLRSFWLPLIGLSWIAGILLRVLFVEDMEYKEDEEYNFVQTQRIGVTHPWPWYGIPSGVYLVNPGMSIWVFTLLAKVFRIHNPMDLAHAVQIFALLGMSLIIPFVLRWIKNSDEKETWLWAFSLAMVNPFLVLYQRKLWPEPFLPFFTMLTLMGWWCRTTRIGALIWGLVGACLGQVHMSGFFFSAALFLWTVLFDRSSHSNQPSKPALDDSASLALQKIEWKYWFLGSVLGALPLIPWLIYIVQNPIQQSMSAGWQEIIQLKYWAFWFSNPTGLHLGNPVGLLRGQSNWDQISDFIRYPVLSGRPTYLNGLAHLAAAIATLFIWGQGLIHLLNSWFNKRLVHEKSKWNIFARQWIGKESDTAFLQNSALWGCGILLTVTGVVIRRYYMAVTFPLEFIFLVRMARPSSARGRALLFTLWAAELLISAHFVGYIHVHEGSLQGDYGPAYHLRLHPKN